METKIILDYEKLATFVEAHKILEQRVVCTIGSWDMLHIGHLRYLNRAKKKGDILIVGADSDRAIKLYKNEFRPIIPEKERLEMLSYQNCVDYVTLIDDIDERGEWHFDLIKKTNPDIFVCIAESYPKDQQLKIKQYCNYLIELPRQADNTSTSDIIEKTIKTHLSEINKLSDPNTANTVTNNFNS